MWSKIKKMNEVLNSSDINKGILYTERMKPDISSQIEIK